VRKCWTTGRFQPLLTKESPGPVGWQCLQRWDCLQSERWQRAAARLAGAAIWLGYDGSFRAQPRHGRAVLMSALLRLTDSSRTSRHVRKVPRLNRSTCGGAPLLDMYGEVINHGCSPVGVLDGKTVNAAISGRGCIIYPESFQLGPNARISGIESTAL
jgi:hypothetical protein